MASAGSGPRRSHGLLCQRKLLYNLGVPISSIPLKKRWLVLTLLPLIAQHLPAQQPPPASGARILIIPRKIFTAKHPTLPSLLALGPLSPASPPHFPTGAP